MRGKTDARAHQSSRSPTLRRSRRAAGVIAGRPVHSAASAAAARPAELFAAPAAPARRRSASVCAKHPVLGIGSGG